MARYKKYIVGYGDTIQSISQGEAGSVSMWQEIVKYNNLVYPYIVPTVKDKLKNPEQLITIGDTLIIPIEVDLLDTNLASLGQRDRELILSLTLGRDLAMTSDEESYRKRGGQNEILGLSASYKGDIQTAQGVDNLKQAIIARLLTPRGSLLLHPSYGSNLAQSLGKKGTIEQLVIIEDEIVSTIKKDSRIDSVTVERSYLEEDVYHGEFNVYLQSLQEYFNIVVEGDKNGQIALF